jgi:hypothetical protein
VLAAQGRLAEVPVAYQNAFAISDMLVSQDPSNVDSQIVAARRRYGIANMLMQIKDGDREEAKRIVAEGIEIMKRLEHQGALDRNTQDTVNKLNELANTLASSSRGQLRKGKFTYASRSKNHPTKIKRSRTRLQLVLRKNWYWGPAALC